MQTWDTERDLYVRALKNLYDLLEQLHLTHEGREMTPEALAHYREGLNKFYRALVLVTKSVRYHSGREMIVPFVTHEAGHA